MPSDQTERVTFRGMQHLAAAILNLQESVRILARENGDPAVQRALDEATRELEDYATLIDGFVKEKWASGMKEDFSPPEVGDQR